MKYIVKYKSGRPEKVIEIQHAAVLMRLIADAKAPTADLIPKHGSAEYPMLFIYDPLPGPGDKPHEYFPPETTKRIAEIDGKMELRERIIAAIPSAVNVYNMLGMMAGGFNDLTLSAKGKEQITDALIPVIAPMMRGLSEKTRLVCLRDLESRIAECEPLIDPEKNSYERAVNTWLKAAAELRELEGGE